MWSERKNPRISRPAALVEHCPAYTSQSSAYVLVAKYSYSSYSYGISPVHLPLSLPNAIVSNHLPD